MSTPRFSLPPHTFDAHTHRMPLPSDTHTAIYNLRLPTPHHIQQACAWLQAHPWVYTSVGIHPWDSAAWTLADLPALTTLLAHPQVVALGECGLDRLHGEQTPQTLAHQMALFRAQATLAQQQRLPLIIHCVKAHSELLHLRGQYPDALWIVHGFRAKLTVAEQLWHKGIATSFGEHYQPAALQHCPPALCYHETDESPLAFAQIIEQHHRLRLFSVSRA